MLSDVPFSPPAASLVEAELVTISFASPAQTLNGGFFVCSLRLAPARNSRPKHSPPDRSFARSNGQPTGTVWIQLRRLTLIQHGLIGVFLGEPTCIKHALQALRNKALLNKVVGHLAPLGDCV
jgi:hypothetical protein